MLYCPRHFENKDEKQLLEFIKTYDFATVISQAVTAQADELPIQVSHLPLILLADEGEHGTLVGHMAKGNRQWQDFNNDASVLCIFHGPHAYISPTWYQNIPEVPTWNYAVVHAYGTASIITDTEEFKTLMNDTLLHYEPSLLDPATAAYIPNDYKEQLLKRIVGFKIKITRLVGKFKLDQNSQADDQTSMVDGLAKAQDPHSHELADFIKHYHKDNDRG